MRADFDVIVAGLGAMGSASCYHLTRNGRRVLGLDRFRPPHDRGSSHGRTRIIREAYFEHPLYVPLVQRAYELWADLESKSGRRLLLPTGGVMIGPANGPLVTGARRSAEQHRLPHEILAAEQLALRFPVFRPASEMIGVWEPRAGVLFPELAIQTHLELAAANGATLRYEEPILKWQPDGSGVQVETAVATYRADRLLLSVGAWIRSLIPELNLPLTVERQLLFWFQPTADTEAFRQGPIFICEYAPHQFFYGFPDIGDGMKVAFHHEGELTEPDRLRREADDGEVETMRAVLRRFLPGADGRLNAAVACMYTNTPDEHFLIDRHPSASQVLIASPCSGHGFKFSPVIGELTAALLQDRVPAFDLSLFKLQRLMQ